MERCGSLQELNPDGKAESYSKVAPKPGSDCDSMLSDTSTSAEASRDLMVNQLYKIYPQQL